jgi:endonuclease/exonuclease/phosphatase family metal-dependent hydrolase
MTLPATAPIGRPLAILCWNVNHRVGRTAYRPEAAHAAMACAADVLAFTEFFPRDQLAAFQATLREGGWEHQALSEAPSIKANRVLVASRVPLQVRSLPASTVDEHLSSNALRVQVDGWLELLCVRVPTYTGSDRAAAWDWLAHAAAETRLAGPALLVGDLNTSLAAKPRVPQFHALADSWSRLQPSGPGGYFGRGDIVSEIDHAFVAGAAGTARYVTQLEGFRLAGAEGAISDHAALHVQLKV